MSSLHKFYDNTIFSFIEYQNKFGNTGITYRWNSKLKTKSPGLSLFTSFYTEDQCTLNREFQR